MSEHVCWVAASSQYNMAGTVLHWVKHAHIKEEYILILDSDMVLLRPLLPSQLGIAPGHAVADFYGYLKACSLHSCTPYISQPAFAAGRHPTTLPNPSATHQNDAAALRDWQGVAYDLAERYIPEIPRCDDLLADPRGRRSDQVGGGLHWCSSEM